MIIIVACVLVITGTAAWGVNRMFPHGRAWRVLMSMLMEETAWSDRASRKAIKDFEKYVLRNHDRTCLFIQLFWEQSAAVADFLDPHVKIRKLPDAVQQSFEIKGGLIRYDDAFAHCLADCIRAWARDRLNRRQIVPLVRDQIHAIADLIDPETTGEIVWKEDGS